MADPAPLASTQLTLPYLTSEGNSGGGGKGEKEGAWVTLEVTTLEAQVRTVELLRLDHALP